MIELALRHPWIVDALKGVARSHADAGTVTRVRRPIAWSVLLLGESICNRWGPGGRVLWLALGASFFFLARAGEIFASKEGQWDHGHCLRRGDVAFFRKGVQLDWTMWGQADTVEVRFKSSKADQLREGAILTREREGPPIPLQGGGGPVDLMIELMSSYLLLPPHAPLAAFGGEAGKWSVWTQARATAALREVVALAGLPAREYALHSLRIGGATYLSAGGATAEVIQREGRWKSDAFKGYVRPHRADAQTVSDMLANADNQPASQPGMGTEWGIDF